MRKLTLFVLALFAANLSFAQKGLEVGLEFTPAVTFIINSEDFAEGDDLDFRGTFGYNTGLSLGYNFNDGLGISSGIIFSRQGQNYTTAIDGVAKSSQDLFERKLSYIRVPLLLKFNGDPSASSSSYFRIGPHFDFLQGASYEYTDNGARGLLGSTSAFYAQDKVSLLKDAEFSDLAIYRKFVFGVTLEFGGSANINEYLKLTFMLHMSGNLNSEDIGAAQAATGSLIPLRTPLMYMRDTAGGRSASYNVMGGINVGFRYTIMMD